MKKPLKFILFTFLFSLGILTGYFLGAFYQAKKTEAELSLIHPIRQNNNQYSFINPLLGYDTPESIDFSEIKPLEKKVQNFIDQQIAQNKISRAAVYYKNLNNGRWMSINEDFKFTPASLLKIPLLIAYYKTAESRPEILKNQLRKTDEFDQNANELIKSENSMEQDTPYTVEQLLDFMIKDSDNNAAILLFDSADKNFFKEIFSDLRIPLPDSDSEQDFITVKDVAFFFRILYNATYLNRDFSEKALSILSQTKFKEGLAAAVPPSITVAHKFGEYTLISKGNVEKRQLHDCGIIYYPDYPYKLCVMTEGKDVEDLKKTISNISKIVYDQIEAEKK